jgi:hypothetical protein
MADNTAAFAALDAHLEKLRRLEGLNEEAAKDVGKAFGEKVDRNVAAQVDPYGHAWPKSKTGEPVLQGAAEAVQVSAKGTEITLELTGAEVKHHVGSARGYHGGSKKLGGFRRPIIPWKGLPGPFKAVCREVLEKHFARIMGGRT